jgi:hypothetical protein
MSLKLFFGILSIIPAIFAYFYYFRDIFDGRTKPHSFSWLIFGTLSANGFIAQVNAHAGFGAWATGLTSVASLTIFCLSLFKGDTNPSLFDWLLLGLSLTGFALLFVVNNKVLALYITLFALVAGFAMTIRKSYRKPEGETAKAFVLNTIKFIPSIFALSNFTFLTVAYPVTAAIGNAAIAWVIILRSSHLKSVSKK